MDVWQQRVAQVKPGMTLAEAERLLPIYIFKPSQKPAAARTITFGNNVIISISDSLPGRHRSTQITFGGESITLHDVSDMPLTITMGAHSMIQYHVAPRILASIDFATPSRESVTDQDCHVNSASVRYEPVPWTAIPAQTPEPRPEVDMIPNFAPLYVVTTPWPAVFTSTGVSTVLEWAPLKLDINSLRNPAPESHARSSSTPQETSFANPVPGYMPARKEFRPAPYDPIPDQLFIHPVPLEELDHGYLR